MKYDVDFFITKFEAIPEELWCKREFTSPDNPEVHCAYGHCGANTHVGTSEESMALHELFDSNYLSVVMTNDHSYKFDMREASPKQRILAALRDIKAKQHS